MISRLWAGGVYGALTDHQRRKQGEAGHQRQTDKADADKQRHDRQQHAHAQLLRQAPSDEQLRQQHARLDDHVDGAEHAHLAGPVGNSSATRRACSK